MTPDWLAFWDGPHSIYVNARHKDVHYLLIAKEIAALVPGPRAHVLDYGCGEALHADIVAAAAGELFLCEAASGVREGLADRFAGQRNIHVLAPHEAARLAEHSLDLIVLHSVTQTPPSPLSMRTTPISVIRSSSARVPVVSRSTKASDETNSGGAASIREDRCVIGSPERPLDISERSFVF